MVGRTTEGDFKPPYATALAPQRCHLHFFADRPTQGSRRPSVRSVFKCWGSSFYGWIRYPISGISDGSLPARRGLLAAYLKSVNFQR